MFHIDEVAMATVRKYNVVVWVFQLLLVRLCVGVPRTGDEDFPDRKSSTPGDQPSDQLPMEHRQTDTDSVATFLKLLQGDVTFESLFNPPGSVPPAEQNNLSNLTTILSDPPSTPTSEANDPLTDIESLLNEVSNIDKQKNDPLTLKLLGNLLGYRLGDNQESASDQVDVGSVLGGNTTGSGDALVSLLFGGNNTPSSDLSDLGSLITGLFSPTLPTWGAPSGGSNVNLSTFNDFLLGTTNGNRVPQGPGDGDLPGFTSEADRLFEAERDVLQNFEQELRNYLNGGSASSPSFWNVFFPGGETKGESGNLLNTLLNRKSEFLARLRDQFVSTFLKILPTSRGAVDMTTVDNLLDPTISRLSATLEEGSFGVLPLLGSTKKLLRTLRDDIRHIVTSLTPGGLRGKTTLTEQGFIPLDDGTIYNLGAEFDNTVQDLNNQFPESRSDKAGVVWQGLSTDLEDRLRKSLKKLPTYRPQTPHEDPIITTQVQAGGRRMPPRHIQGQGEPQKIHYIHLPPNSSPKNPSTHYHHESHANYPVGHDPHVYGNPTSHQVPHHASTDHQFRLPYEFARNYEVRQPQPGFYPDNEEKTNWKIDFLLDWNSFGKFGSKWVKRNYAFRPQYGDPALFEPH